MKCNRNLLMILTPTAPTDYFRSLFLSFPRGLELEDSSAAVRLRLFGDNFLPYTEQPRRMYPWPSIDLLTAATANYSPPPASDVHDRIFLSSFATIVFAALIFVPKRFQPPLPLVHRNLLQVIENRRRSVLPRLPENLLGQLWYRKRWSHHRRQDFVRSLRMSESYEASSYTFIKPPGASVQPLISGRKGGGTD